MVNGKIIGSLFSIHNETYLETQSNKFHSLSFSLSFSLSVSVSLSLSLSLSQERYIVLHM